MADNYPEQIECDLGPEFRSHKGASWRYTAPSRWSEREQRAYAVRAKAAQRGDGEGQRECLSWLDSVLHQ